MVNTGSWQFYKWILQKRKLPTKGRRAKWDAKCQFEELVTHLNPADTVIDCGANQGKFTQIFADSGATVHAFEPDPYSFAILSEKFDGRANVHLHNAAVGANHGAVQLYRAKNFESNPKRLCESSSIFASKGNVDASVAIEVEQIDLIEFIDSLPNGVALLKVDIEGAEVPLLEKLLDSGVIDKVRQTFVETHDRKITELAARTNALRSRIADEGRKNINLHWR